MKRKLTKIFMAAAACLALTAGTTMAQNGRFSLGAELAMPMGDFGDAVGIGFGGTLRYEHPIGDMMGLGLTAGWMTFGGKDDGPSISMIPIQAFFKYYFGEQQNGLYAAAHLGIHMANVAAQDYTYTNPLTGQEETIKGESSSSTNLSYAPEIGYHLANIDIGLRYQMFSQSGEDYTDPLTGTTIKGESSTSSYLGVRLAYVFGEK